MGLNRSIVHRNLDSKVMILGMELFDVIGVGIFASTMNLVFGQTSMAGVMVFGLPALLAVVIYVGKKGKPERYLQDVIRFSVLPGTFCVAEELSHENKRKKEIVFESK